MLGEAHPAPPTGGISTLRQTLFDSAQGLQQGLRAVYPASAPKF